MWLKITSFDGHTGNVTAVGFQRECRWMYSGSEDGTIKIWDMRFPSAAFCFQKEPSTELWLCVKQIDHHPAASVIMITRER